MGWDSWGDSFLLSSYYSPIFTIFTEGNKEERGISPKESLQPITIFPFHALPKGYPKGYGM